MEDEVAKEDSLAIPMTDGREKIAKSRSRFLISGDPIRNSCRQITITLPVRSFVCLFVFPRTNRAHENV